MKRLTILLFFCGAVFAQNTDMKDCPMHAQHMSQTEHSQSKAELDARGYRSMGFDQQKTTHHFLLSNDGGSIAVTVNDARDKSDLAAVQRHLAHLATAFRAGDFSLPMATHGEMPPGAVVMSKLRHRISYSTEQLQNGVRLRIKAADPQALSAIHDFLRYQIREHETRDPLEVK